MKEIDISYYLRPTHGDDASDRTTTDGASYRPKHDPTYSALLGWGFGKPKLLPPDPPPAKADH